LLLFVFFDLVLHFKVITAEVETYSYAQAPVLSRNGNFCTSSRIPPGEVRKCGHHLLPA